MEELLLKIIRTLPSNEARAKLLQIYIQEYGAISNEIGVEIRKIMRKESR